MTADLEVVGGRTLIDGAFVGGARILVAGGSIAEIGGSGGRARRMIEARGALVLPGIVDLHGDGFERQIMPRPGVNFDLRLALAETDRQAAANGITTAYHAVTWSWEPGLRGRAAVIAFADALEALRPRLDVDTRLHLRWEVMALDDAAEIGRWVEAGRVDLLAFNDHLPELLGDIRPAKLLRFSERTGLDGDAVKSLARALADRRGEAPAAIDALAATARAKGVTMASHDDDAPATRAHYRALGCAISEFPKTVETARAARAAGDHIVMGAPNVIRGGSHLNATSADSLVRAGLCPVLTSDYYYPALLQAPFALARAGSAPLADAWALVSSEPAAAAGLRDRGTLTPGKRADIVIVDDHEQPPRVAVSIVAGRVVYQSRCRTCPVE
jgi:alpha-D-ribose 1-methylphosphonate 5-triphosphate diphosphatase